MFKPARMTRVLIGGHRDRLENVIDVLHSERLVHMEDFQDPTGTTTIGTPLERGDETSGLLLRVRGLIKGLGSEGMPAKEFTGAVNKAVVEAEKAIEAAVAKQTEMRSIVHQMDGEVSGLARLAELDVVLVDDVASVRFFIGTSSRDPDMAGITSEVWRAGDAIAVAVAAADGDKTERALSAAGFQPATISAGTTGTPKQALGELTKKHADAVANLAAAEADVAGLAATWGPRLASMERHLAADVSKTQAPLKMAVTASTFHIEGWIPVDRANRVQNAIAAKFNDGVYFESLGDAPTGDPHHSSAAEEAPVALRNRGSAKPFEFLLGLLGRPRYGELDPTKLMFIFFPLFFGFMVGDVIVGLAIMAFGLYLKGNNILGIGGPSVGRALFMGGVMAVMFGFVVYGEGLGIHFVVDDHGIEEGEMSWESIIYGTHIDENNHTVLSGHFPTEGFIYKTSGHGAEVALTADGAHGIAADKGTATFDLKAEATEEHSSPFTFAPHSDTHLSVNGWFNLGYYSKIHDVVPLLMWSIVIGVTHIVLGLMIGIRNVYASHGLKLAVQEKVSWLMILGGTFALAASFGAANLAYLKPVGVGVLVAGVAFLYFGVKHTVGVGFIAFLEVPAVFGSILSYARLAAIGASKAGMAIAFGAIGTIVGGVQGGAVWWIVYIFGMIAITLLAILSGGLQSLRLQFVEFFQKFYSGGGRAYNPFGRRQ